jgi:prepilin-type N-terminal cleavage/methylation domain-containing protein
MNRMRRRVADDGGFTLIELLSTVIIMGIIIIPLGNFMLEYLKNTTDSQDRIADSHDMQIATAYFSQDVANMGVRDSSGNLQASAWTSASSPYCGSGAGSLVLLLSWSAVNTTTVGGVTTETTSKVSSAAYVNESGVLHRLYCDSGNSTTSDTTMAHNFAGATVVCDTTCNAVPPPTTITLNLSIASTGDRTAPDTVPLIGHRRQ